jgi:hypothetical protein
VKRRAFNDPLQYPDLTVTCLDRTWHCHRVILCNRSEWFRRACSGGFKEGGASTIAVKEDNLSALEAMLAFCYGLKLQDSASAHFSIQVFALAEKYFVEGLMNLAADRFATAARKTDQKLEDLVPAIEDAYSTTSDVRRMLRNTICDLMIEKNGEFMGGQHETTFHKLIDSCPDFSADMAKSLAGSLKRKRTPVEGASGGRGAGWYLCPLECGGTTYSSAVLYGADTSKHTLRCGKCGEMSSKYPASSWRSNCST